jgi:hypothetical protein
MSGIDGYVDSSNDHDDYDPETDDVMLWAIGGGVILEGPAGEYVLCKRPVAVKELA